MIKVATENQTVQSNVEKTEWPDYSLWRS